MFGVSGNMASRIGTLALLLILMISVLVGTPGCTSHSGKTPDSPPLPTTTPTVSELEGLHRNAYHGFSIRYPADWDTVRGAAGEAVLTVRSPAGHCAVQVFVESIPRDTSLAEWSDVAINTVKPKLADYHTLSESAVQIGSDRAREQQFTGIESGSRLTAKLLSLVRDDQGFALLAACDEEVWDLQRETIDDILYSFRLTEPFSLDLAREEYLALYDSGPITLDPAVVRDSGSVSFIMEIFSGLVTLDRDLEIVPDIARAWDVSADGTVYTFYLCEDAAFHDGKPITAADFKYSLERACDPATNSTVAAEYLGDIVGVRQRLSGDATEVAGIRVIDEHTLQLTIDAPKSYFLAKLLYPTAFVVDRENVRSGKDWWRTPNGSGPFELGIWQEDEILVLKRNDLYYGHKPSLEAVVFRLWAGSPMTMYELGEIDLTYVSTAYIDRVRDPQNPLNRELVTVPELSLSYIGFDCSEPPFDDSKVRQAFAHAIDKGAIARLILKDIARPASGILPPGMPGYNEDLEGLEFEPEKARAALRECRYGGPEDLPAITYTTAGLGDVSPITEALADMWQKNLGVAVTVRQIEPERYPYVIREEKDDLFDIGWMADYPDPQNFLDVLFHSRSEENIGEYSNPEIDEMLEEARRETDPDARTALYQDIEQALVADAACIPLFFSTSYILVKPYVKGFIPSPLPIPWLKYVSIEADE